MGYEIIIQSLWLVLPAYIANASALLFGGRTPIDFGKNWRDGKRILGDGKTVRGFVSGVLGGIVTCVAIIVVTNQINYPLAFMNLVNYPITNKILFGALVGFLLGFGALFGDIAGSFIKRRLRLKRGADVPLLDQWNFIIGAVLFAMWFTEITVWMLLLMLLITPLVHRIANIVAHKLKIKKEPW